MYLAVAIARDRDRDPGRAEGRKARRPGRREQVAVFGVGVFEQDAVHGDLIGAPVRGHAVAIGRGHGDRFVEILAVVGEGGVNAVFPVGQDSDTTDDGAVLVERKATRGGR